MNSVKTTEAMQKRRNGRQRQNLYAFLPALVLSLLLAQCAGREAAEEPLSPWARVGNHYMVAADSPFASQAGVEILEKGGNAVDAAVAAAFALSVTRPSSTGIGGGGFLIAKEPGKEALVLDFRETAPASAKPSRYLDSGGNVIENRTVFEAATNAFRVYRRSSAGEMVNDDNDLDELSEEEALTAGGRGVEIGEEEDSEG